MYYILYEGLKIESNAPVYCTMYTHVRIIYYFHYCIYILLSHYINVIIN